MQNTETNILDAAERLFVANGYGATSIRSITREAGVNVAAVHYHFGSKETVLRGVLDRIVGPINERRRELLEALDADPSVAELVEAFVRPDLEVLQELQRRNQAAARFAGRTYADHAEPMATITREQFLPIGSQFVERFAQAMPHLSRDEVWWRMGRAVAVIVDIFSGYPEEGLSPEETEQTIRRLVVFLTAGMEAADPRGDATNDE